MKLFTEGAATDRLFLSYRDDPWLHEGREYIESLWDVYEEYCPDEHFTTEIRHQFHQRTWEIFLACSLISNGHRLCKPGQKGPDICIDADPPIWIEAVSVKAGSGEDRVPLDEERLDTCIPQEDGIKVISPPSEESVILRCTHALKTKGEQITRWKKSGVLPMSDPCVVAISLGAIEGADFFTYRTCLPVFCKAFLGLGELFYNPSNDEQKLGYLSRHHILKAGGDAISTRSFLDRENCDVSGVVCSGRGIFNMRDSTSDLLFIHNPTALNPINRGVIRAGKEWLLEGSRLKCVE